VHIASIENFAKSYGDNVLFENITFHINQGDKIALIARNGQGKTSLLNILAGLDKQDAGDLWIHKDVQVVYLKQENNFNPANTIEQQLFEMDHPTVKLLKEYEKALEEQRADTPHFQELLSQMNEGDAWNFEGAYKEIIGKLHLPSLDTKIETLSGGQKKRLALAQALLETQLYEGSSLFILDEPTNHLDIEMIEWLESKLNTAKSTLLLVSHDRYFIDAVCNILIEIEKTKAYKHSGNYQLK
jgi:ATP-binding cassette subfamily F protein uup